MRLRKAGAPVSPGGEDGGSWTGGVFQRWESCLLLHLPGPTLARRSRRLRLPDQDVNSEYPFHALGVSGTLPPAARAAVCPGPAVAVSRADLCSRRVYMRC